MRRCAAASAWWPRAPRGLSLVQLASQRIVNVMNDADDACTDRWDTGVGLIALMTRRYMINRRVTNRGDWSDMRDVRYWYGTGTELGLHRTPLDCTEISSISLLSKKE